MTDNAQAEMTANLQKLFGLTDLVTPMAIRVAATLKLVDRISEGADTVDTLASATGTDPVRLELLIGLLKQNELMQESEGKLSVTPLGALMHSGPGSFQMLLDLEGLSGKYDTAALGMLEAIRSGASAFGLVHGVGYWQDLAGNADAVQLLNAMEPSTPAFDAKLLSTDFDWSGAGTLLDVGGSNGSVLAQILTDHSHLSGAVLDLPERIEKAGEVFAGHGVSERAKAIGGSFFEDVPAEYDVYVLSAILADWDDINAVRILSRVREALPENGRVIVSEIRMQPPEAPRDYQLALRMLCGTGGIERTAEQVSALAAEAGLAPSGTTASSGVRSIQAFTAV